MARYALRSWIALAFALGSARAQNESTLQLIYLANMGVLLEVGNHRVVIDGLHRGELPGMEAIPRDLLASLEARAVDSVGSMSP